MKNKIKELKNKINMKKRLLVIVILALVFLATLLIPRPIFIEGDLGVGGDISFSNESLPSYIEVDCEWYLEQDYPNMNLTLNYNESEMEIDLFELCLELEKKEIIRDALSGNLEIIEDGYVWGRDATIPKYMLYLETGEIIEILDECNKCILYDEYLKCIGDNSEPIEINLEYFSGNFEVLEDAKYNIKIDCEWVKEHLNDTTIWFPNQVIKLCEYVYSDLWEELK